MACVQRGVGYMAVWRSCTSTLGEHLRLAATHWTSICKQNPHPTITCASSVSCVWLCDTCFESAPAVHRGCGRVCRSLECCVRVVWHTRCLLSSGGLPNDVSLNHREGHPKLFVPLPPDQAAADGAHPHHPTTACHPSPIAPITPEGSGAGGRQGAALGPYFCYES
jgi:hypothetical protein